MTYPPMTPNAFDSVPTSISTLPSSLKWLTMPLPLSPKTPSPWASSTMTIAPYSSATSTISGKGAMSPSMLKTPSVTTSIRLAESLFSSIFFLRSAASLWAYLTTLAFESLQPSIILAWFSSSEKIMSPSPVIVGMTARFATNPP